MLGNMGSLSIWGIICALTTVSSFDISSSDCGVDGIGDCVGHQNPENCNKIYYCENGKLLNIPCEDGEYYNPLTYDCEPQEKVECPYRGPPTCPIFYRYTEKLYSNPDNCKNYYFCKPELWYAEEKSCPDGLYFNPIRLICDYPENVNCYNNLICPPQGQNDTPIFLPYPNDCSKFYVCDHGQPTEINCPDGFYFNPIKLICDYPENVNCYNFICPRKGETDDTIFVRNMDDLSKYYICVHGEAIELSCPDGLLFNNNLSVCQHPGNVTCT